MVKFPHCEFVLPSVYNDSLSYYEAVCKLYKSFNDLVTNVNETLTSFEDISKKYTDEQIGLFRDELNDIIKTLEDSYSEFRNNVISNLNAMNTKISTQDETIKQGLASTESLVNLRIKQNNDYIFETIGNEQINVKVVNYFTGELVTIQQMFDYLAKFHLKNAITYSGLIEKNKTYDELISLDITYTQLATNGGQIII